MDESSVLCTKTYGKRSFTENDDVHVERLQICRAVLILVETPETDKIIVVKQLYLLSRFLHLDIFSRQRVDGEHLSKVDHR